MSANATLPPSDGGSSGLPPGDRLIRGTAARWNETAGWVDRDGLPLPKEMFVIGHDTALQKWKDKKSENIIAHPLPNPDVLNSTIPVSEWELDLNGKPTPPWKLTYAIYLVDLNTGALFTYANHTYGARLAYDHLAEQISITRMLRGALVFPIVRLEKRPMKTQFGMKSRPHLQIIDWRAIGGDSGDPKLASPPPTPQISGPATATAPTPPASPPATPSTTSPTTAAASGATASVVLDNTKPVKPVTLAEIVADEIPWK